jgi:hypothetical protein
MFTTGGVVELVAEVAVLAIEKKVDDDGESSEGVDGWRQSMIRGSGRRLRSGESPFGSRKRREIPRFARNDVI